MGYAPDGPIMREKPVCFVLHGGPGGHHTIYKPELSPLSELMQLVYIDNRGSGLSERGPQSTYTMENNVEDLEALRKHLGLDKIVLFGQSYGGMLALSYAVTYPQNVEGLLLVTTSPSHRFIDRAKQYLNEHGTPEQIKIAQTLWDGKFESMEQLNEFYKVIGPLYAYTSTVNTQVESNSAPKKETVTENASKRKGSVAFTRSFEALNEGFGGFLREYDVVAALRSINVPTFIVGARHDWITPVKESFILAENIPDNEFVLFEKSGHAVFRDVREELLFALLDFVRRRLI
jgi:proline iminopeptidase